MKRSLLKITLIAFAIAVLSMISANDSQAGWTSMSSGVTETLYGIWGSAGNDAFAVGSNGTTLYYNGTGWSPMTSGVTDYLLSVWGSAGNDVFAVGYYGLPYVGIILHYNGTNWSTMKTVTGYPLNDVWGTSGSDVFAVGESGTILHYDGISWTPMTSGTGEELDGIWGSSGTDVFAVGSNGTIIHYNGTKWLPMTSGLTSEIIYDVWGSSGNDVFVVASGGTILHYDGTSWSAMNSGTTALPWDVWGSSGSDVFASGGGGLILHYDGMPSPTTTTTAGSTTTTSTATTTTVPSTSHTIAGTVMGEVSDGVTVILDGDLNQVTVTDPGGYYEFLSLPDGGSFIIRPELEGYEFDPPQYEIPNLMNDELNVDFMSSVAPFCPTEVIYGEDSEEVKLLRALRDDVLSKTPEGREIIKQYYNFSPLLVEAMKGDEEFKNEVADIIDEVLMMIR